MKLMTPMILINSLVNQNLLSWGMAQKLYIIQVVGHQRLPLM